MTRAALVIFDCDGVVVDSERPTLAFLRDELAAHGLDLTVAQVTEMFIGGTMQGVFEEARRRGASLPDGWVESYYRRLYALLAEEVEPVPGIETVLDALEAAGVPFAIGSNGRAEKMVVTLGRTGLAPRFEGRAFSAQDPAHPERKPKPAPDIYLWIAQSLGVAPDQAVVVEDSPTGARAAKAAGMRCYGFTRETPQKRMEGIADVLFEDMADLPELLDLT
ncbi:HAD family hydrolase [Pseudoruegeria sp. SHC-113]|uniref:HAD family hydrolase n=1 Tax=Pseudoruegeria sp. SHC-113 TaxID=2855439 RepID=UPI0021BA6BCA|nr:HAD family phosphatase [Pseudoruegeria sp. SHC-113]MCT8162063.1 HAD family phosphatase [Pseudoruegeria sp. SHC-113]